MTTSHPLPEVEEHPLLPFLPPEARLLMLGSFPPPRYRWSMDFYYPNWNNDMWRIVGTSPVLMTETWESAWTPALPSPQRAQSPGPVGLPRPSVPLP